MMLFDDTELPPPEGTRLPPLLGTPKQITWAEDIRKGALAQCHQVIREWQRLQRVWDERGDAERVNQTRAQLRSAIDRLAELEKTSSATWWIDHRDLSPRDLLLRKPAEGESR